MSYAAGRKPDAEAIETMVQGVARVIEVPDEEVEDAMWIGFGDTHNVAEGEGAIGLAARLQDEGAGGVVLRGGECRLPCVCASFGRLLGRSRFALYPTFSDKAGKDGAQAGSNAAYLG